MPDSVDAFSLNKVVVCVIVLLGVFLSTLCLLLLYTDCPEGTFGTNCESVCKCDVNATCDPVDGCSTCLAVGFTGGGCDIDIDECSVEPDICDSRASCVNLNGSYSCVCDTWYKMGTGSCEGKH